jgi:hypothetical protein
MLKEAPQVTESGPGPKGAFQRSRDALESRELVAAPRPEYNPL